MYLYFQEDQRVRVREGNVADGLGDAPNLLHRRPHLNTCYASFDRPVSYTNNSVLSGGCQHSYQYHIYNPATKSKCLAVLL